IGLWLLQADPGSPGRRQRAIKQARGPMPFSVASCAAVSYPSLFSPEPINPEGSNRSGFHLRSRFEKLSNQFPRPPEFRFLDEPLRALVPEVRFSIALQEPIVYFCLHTAHLRAMLAFEVKSCLCFCTSIVGIRFWRVSAAPRRC